MGFDVGTIVTGKVAGIKKFGAFVTLEQGKSGLVHISEIANTYVDDVAQHLQEGQEVKVKIIGIDDAGRINLSIKKAEEQSAPPRSEPPTRRQYNAAPNRPQGGRSPQQSAPRDGGTFEDKLKQFMQDSNSKMSGMEMYSASKRPRRKPK